MNSSPEVTRLIFGEQVLRGDRAGLATTARFAVDLRTSPAPTDGQLREYSAAYSEAQAAGYAAGWAEGRRAAAQAAIVEAEEAQAAAAAHVMEYILQLKQAITAVSNAASRLDKRATPQLAEMEGAIVSTAFALAEIIVGRELATAADPGMDAIQRVLRVVPDGGPVTVRLNPGDLATVVENLGATTETIDGRTVTLLADPRLQPGDATAECDSTRVEVRIDEVLDRVRAEVLRKEDT